MTLDENVKKLAIAIRNTETGGNYAGVGASGEGGAYQWMPGNFSAGAKKYLGDENAPMTEENQNKVAYYTVKELKDKGYGPGQIASMWNAGDPEAYLKDHRGVNKYGVAYDTPAYVSKVQAEYSRLSGEKQEAARTEQSKEKQGLVPSIGQKFMEVGAGALKGAGSTLYGLEQIGEKIGKKALGAVGIERQAGVLQKPKILEPKTTAEKFGYGAEQIGEFLLPSSAVVKGSKFLTGVGKGAGLISDAKKTSLGVRALSGATRTAAKAVPEAVSAGAVTLAQTGGGVEQAKGSALLAAGITAGLPVLGKVAQKAKGVFTGNLQKDVSRAVGMTGKMGVTQTLGKVERSTRALKTIAANKNVIVKDIDGIEKAFDPTKATFGETLQALKSTKDKVYGEYTALAEKAGLSGARFTQKDFKNVITTLEKEGLDATSATKNKVRSLVSDIEQNFGKLNEADGTYYFKNTDLRRIQSFLEKVNVDVNPLSDKAGAEISGTLSRTIREILDDKILSSTGGKYQALRNSYADLKSIENELIGQFKKSMRGTGSGVANWIEGYGGLDAIVALLTGNPQQVVRGIGLTTFAKIMRKLRDPETSLRRAFSALEKQITKEELKKAGMSDLIASRIVSKLERGQKLSPSEQEKIGDIIKARFGGGKYALSAEEMLGVRAGQAGKKYVKEYSKNPKVGMSIEDVSKRPAAKTDDALIQEARKYKSAEVRDKTGIKLQDPYTAEYLSTNPDGTITVYHSTTKAGAEKIKQSGILGSKTEGGDIYFTTNKKGYGGIGRDKNVVLEFHINPKKVKFDDIYRGEIHLKGNNTDIGGIKPVKKL